MLAQAAGARRTADGSIGGVRGAHATRSVASAARGGLAGGACDLAGATLASLGASGGPAAALGGLGLATWYSRVMLAGVGWRGGGAS